MRGLHRNRRPDHQGRQVICLHDNYLKRFTDYSSYAGDEGYVINFTREELRKFRLKTTDGKVTGEQIPTLEEVLTELRGKVWFNLDKCGSDDMDIAKVYEVVKRCGCLDRVQFYVGTNSDRAAWLAVRSQRESSPRTPTTPRRWPPCRHSPPST